jgi:predicted thioredoxin/glutaredoxin
MPQASNIKVYVHATCYSSYTLIKYLIDRGLIGRVSISDVSRASDVDGLVLSVPWIKVGYTVAAADPVSGGEVEAMIRESYTPSIGDPLESFIKTLLASSYASSIAFLHGDLGYAAFKELAEASLRAPFTGLDVMGLVEIVKRNGRSLYEELEFKLAKVVSVNYVRDLYWASGGSLSDEGLGGRIDETSILAWLIAKAGVGRVGLPGNPLVAANREGVKLLSGILESEGSRILARVREEQETIFNDPPYTNFMESLGFKMKA